MENGLLLQTMINMINILHTGTGSTGQLSLLSSMTLSNNDKRRMGVLSNIAVKVSSAHSSILKQIKSELSKISTAAMTAL